MAMDATLDPIQSDDTFKQVFLEELRHVLHARKERFGDSHKDESRAAAELVGISLSGGGIRSATFSLGVLQGLARCGLFKHLDYLSSTGGGAFVAGWLLQWIKQCGYNDVEKRLWDTANRGDAPEIQGLRQSSVFPSRRGFSASSNQLLNWLRNVALNLLAMTALLGGSILLINLVAYFLRSSGEATAYLPVVIAFLCAFLLRLLSHPHWHARISPPVRSWVFWCVVGLSIIASMLQIPTVIAAFDSFPPLLRQWMYSSIAIAVLSLIVWFPRPQSVKSVLGQLGAASVAGMTGGFLITKIPLWILEKTPPDPRYLPYAYVTYTKNLEFLSPVILGCCVAWLLLYVLLVNPWISREARGLVWRLSRSLLAFAALWALVNAVWSTRLTTLLLLLVGAALLSISICGLLAGQILRPKTRPGTYFFYALERISPDLFILALAGVIATVLRPIIPVANDFGPPWPGIDLVVGVGLLIFAFLSFWAIKANRLMMHSFHRMSISRNYLVPAAASAPQHAENHDTNLSGFSYEAGYCGPYPLFGASLDVNVEPTGAARIRTVPFCLAPLASGYDASQKNEPAATGKGYRPTEFLGGGISLAGAMAISQAQRSKSPRPSSAGVAMMWTIFDLWQGRLVGNPLRDDTWTKSGPFVEPVYSLREGFGDPATQSAYVRPYPGREFDSLGIYQLVKRQCQYIIAIDASSDSDFSFDDLGATILKCRTDLGVEIDMDIGPFGRTPAASGTHCQLSLIRYSSEKTGLMVYIKPSLSGDEPADISAYAKVHSEFPAAEVADRSFGESDFEIYRRLGQHIVETLMAGLDVRDSTSNQIFRRIRHRLQPDFKEIDQAAETEPQTEPPEVLVDAIASGDCVLCAGPGLAAQAKLPTWSSFLDGLLRAGREQGVIDSASASGLAATLAAGEIEAVADDLTHQLPREFLINHLRSVFLNSAPSEAHKLLAGMPFLGVLNTNMDELSGQAFDCRVRVPADADKLVKDLQSKTRFVANVFGAVNQPRSLLFTLKEFRALLSANEEFRKFLKTLFLRYSVVFVGSTIEGIRDFLEALELPQTAERQHYALVGSSEQLDPVKLRFLARSYNLRIMEYKPQFDYAGLTDFLRELHSEVSQQATPQTASDSLLLESVTLENIGPFDNLHLDLNRSWNLLLGDNGVGKTVLLKAIAAALCGEKAKPNVVTRLLRSGASTGSIRLKVGAREYAVELKRNDDGEVKIASASLSPITYENWLVLGFPALRNIPLVRPKEQGALKRQAPSAEDLLPMLEGEPDSRIASLKQWVVNLDYAIVKRQDLRAQKLLERFFKVLQSMTPDLRLRFHSINEKTMEITVETDGGLVPIEAVSQGTASVMCWIGTLLERLSETGSPLETSSALVLIDELDAHMHPKWQQLFVTAFRQEFPNLQIIATTHSPLLVGSLDKDEIWLMHRAPLKSDIYGLVKSVKVVNGMRELVIHGPETDDGAPRAERIYRLPLTAEIAVSENEIVEEHENLTEQDVHVVAERAVVKGDGWRVDQILTSPLFELQTTRDPETARQLKEYTRLLALDHPTESEREQLADVADELNVRLPTANETEEARKAYELIEEFAKESLKTLPDAQVRSVLNEVKAQLVESTTGSRRPE